MTVRHRGRASEHYICIIILYHRGRASEHYIIYICALLYYYFVSQREGLGALHIIILYHRGKDLDHYICIIILLICITQGGVQSITYESLYYYFVSHREGFKKLHRHYYIVILSQHCSAMHLLLCVFSLNISSAEDTQAWLCSERLAKINS